MAGGLGTFRVLSAGIDYVAMSCIAKRFCGTSSWVDLISVMTGDYAAEKAVFGLGHDHN